MEKDSNNFTADQIAAMSYIKLLDIDLKLDLLNAKIESLQQDVSRSVFVRGEQLRLRFDHATSELYITEYFKIAFEGNEAVLLKEMFKKNSGLPKKTVKFYHAELASSFGDQTKGLKTKESVHGTINRIDATIKHRTMGLEVFKITTKVFYFL